MAAQSITWDMSIVGLSLSIFTLANVFTKPERHRADFVFFCWLIILNIPLLQTMSIHLGYGMNMLKMITNPAVNLLQGPFLFAYVTIMIRNSVTFKPSYFLHFIPFMFFYLLFIVEPSIIPVLPGPEQAHLAYASEKGEGGIFSTLVLYFGFVNTLVFIVYSLITIVLLVKHQKKIHSYFSQNDNQISLKWVYFLPAIFVALLLINIINENDIGTFPDINPITLHLFSYFSFIILLCFFGVKQRPVFAPRKRIAIANEAVEVKREPPEPQEIAPVKTEVISNIGIDDKSVAEIIEKIQAYMNINKPYLEPDFSVYNLAEAIDEPRRTLSYVLNNGLGKNFFQYVNEYRVEEIKKYLQNSERAKSTILDLAFEAGFKSKSSFNSLFKQYCGTTPSQYRKNHKNKKDEISTPSSP